MNTVTPAIKDFFDQYATGRSVQDIDLIAAQYLDAFMAILDVDQHRALFSNAGFTDVHIVEEPRRGWIVCTGVKPVSQRSNA